MKKIGLRLYRALMFLLALLPSLSALFMIVLNDFWQGLIWTAAQTIVAALFTLVPAFVGNYREYEVTRVENRSASRDPNPDRETRRELVREGHRFPLRLAMDIVLLALNLILLTLPGRAMFCDGSMFCKVGFIAMESILLMLAMNNIAMAQCFWLDIPGILLGAIGYLAMAIYLRLGQPQPIMRALITAGAVAYLFLGGVSLNRQSIAQSMSSHTGGTPRAPRLIARRNRRIVLGFSATVTVVSLIAPLRTAILWLLNRIGDVARFLLHLIGFGGSETTSEIPMEFMSAMPMEVEEVVEIAEEGEQSYIFVYIFLGFVTLGLIWIIIDGIRKLIIKLTKWMEKFASGVNEGFYDEREALMTADEMRQQLKNSMKRRLQALINREPKWDELSGRERVRRLMRDFYKKRAYRIKGLRAMTAREAIAAVDKADRARFGELYDRARYSSHEVGADEADRLKKDLKL